MMKTKRLFTKIAKIAVVVFVSIAMLLTFLLGDSAPVYAAEKTADLQTTTKYEESLGDNASTEYAGRVWTDKSVFSDQTVRFSDSNVTVNNDQDFLVAFSALATSKEVEGKTSVPLDVVFVIDLSASMSETMKDANGKDAGSRLKNTIKALNTSISNLMSLNGNTRVAVVGYGSVATTLLPLGHYTQDKDKNNNLIDWFALNNDESKITVTTTTHKGSLSESNASNYGYNGDYYLGGETNIQAGVYTGMNILASLSSTDTTDDKDIFANVEGTAIKRIPSVVILSDGAPTASSNTTSWWNPANNDGNGNGSSYFYGNGLKAMMTATYMKAAIDRKYQLTGNTKTAVYTIGMGVSELDTDGSSDHGKAPRYLAQLTLNPKNYLDENKDNVLDAVVQGNWYQQGDNVHESSMKKALTDYGDNKDVSVIVNTDNSSYKITHPKSNDITVANILNYVNQYYDANSSDTVDSVFKDIVRDISLGAAEVPTAVSGDKNALTDGYITYTDPIGEYMEVKAMKGIVFRNKLYTVMGEPAVTRPSTNTTKTVYTFSENVETYIHGTQQLSNIIIEVTSVARSNGVKDETITIKVPAALIPLRINSIKLNADGAVASHTSNNALPIRVLYTVGLQNGILDEHGHTTTKVSRDYIIKNLNDDGTVDFYSNLFDGKNKIDLVHSDGSVSETIVGNTTVEFTPATTNPFYYMQEDTIIYKTYNARTGELSNPVGANETLRDGTTYYYKGVTYYYGSTIRTEIVQRTGAQLNQVSLTTNGGYKARTAGTARVNRVLEFEGQKYLNSTNTAEDFYAPTYVGNALTDTFDGSFKVYLGNNGVVSYNAPNRLVISKTVAVDEGFDFDLHKDKEFNITIQLTNDSNDVDGTYFLVRNGSTTSETIKVTNGKAMISLKHGEYVTIYGIADGTKYTISENVTKYEDSYEYSDVSQVFGNATTGAEIDTVDVTNTYEPTPLTYPTDETISITKLLTGTDWINAYNGKFSFVLTPYENAPMPEGTDATTGQKTVTLNNVVDKIDDNEHTASIDFGTFEFTKPGTYYYSIVEREPEADKFLAGMTYSRAYYRLIINVTEDGNGNLTADHSIQMMLGQDGEIKYKTDKDGNPVLDKNGLYVVEGTVQTAAFNNRYNASKIIVNPVAVKSYTDNSGHNPISNMFNFKLTPVGYYDDNNELVNDSTIPMYAQNVTNDTVANISHNITFNAITYTTDLLQDEADNKVVYRYKIEELVPEDAVNNTLNGMTYDPTVWYMEVTLTEEDGVLKTNIAYYVGDSETQEERLPTFDNAYNVTPTTATVEVSKILNGRDWQDGDSFTFTLEAYDNITINALDNGNVVFEGTTTEDVVTTLNTTINEDTAGYKNVFDDITFNNIGTYQFAVKETKGNLGGLTYDSHTSIVTVVVTDNNGQLKATVSYENSAKNAQFTNTYNTIPTTAGINLNGKKVLEGRPLTINDFTFTITPVNNAPLGDGNGRSVNDADGNIVLLNNIKFDKAGTYQYIISEYIPTETEGHRPGITNDLSRYEVTVEVTDVKDGQKVGQLTAQITSIKKVNDAEGKVISEPSELIGTNNNINELIEFNNTYVPENDVYSPIVLEKFIDGDRVLEAGEFTFELSLVSGDTAGIRFAGDNDNDHIVTVTNNANGEIIFGDVTFSKVGTYQVKVKEVIPESAKDNVLDGITYDDHEIITTFEVTDNLNGQLVAIRKSIEGAPSFVNKYNTTGELDGNANLNVIKNYRDNNDEDQWADEQFKDHTFKFVLEVEHAGTKTAIIDGSVVLPDNAENLTITSTSTDYSEAFGNIIFNKAGTYEFVVREDTSNLISGVNYDDTPRIVVVEVVDDGEGHLTATSKVYLDNDENLTYSKDDTATTLTFNNVYVPDETILYGHDDLRVTKNFNGRRNSVWLDGDEFNFTLEIDENHAETKDAYDNGHITLENTSLTIDKTNMNHAHFGNITFRLAGQYQFIVKEVVDTSKDYIDYDDNLERTIVVSVTDNESVLSAEVVSGDLVFNNEYTLAPVTLDADTYLNITKELNGRDWNNDDEFKFTLTPIEDFGAKVEMGEQEVVITKGTTGHSAAFGDITFYQPGTYKFIVVEDSSTPVDNVTYDSKELTITVIVTDNNTGDLEIKDGNVQYLVNNQDDDEIPLTYVNTYTPDPTSVSIEGTKSMIGRELRDSDVFEFTLTSIDNAPMPEGATNGKLVVTNTNMTDINFGTITYTADGTYEYTIKETGGKAAGVTNDSKTVHVVVEVSYDDNTGLLTSEVTYDGSTEFEFTNTYVPNKIVLSGNTDLLVAKKFTGREDNEWLSKDVFRFAINPYGEITINATNNGDVVMTVGEVISIDKDTPDFTAHFKDITFNKVGTYQFAIKEIDDEIPGIIYDGDGDRIVTVVVSDEGQDGQLDLDVTGNTVEELTFVNTYINIETTLSGDTYLEVTKELEGRDWFNDDEFEFKLEPVETYADVEMSDTTVTVDKNNQKAAFGDITFKAAGTYKFKITEVDGDIDNVAYTDQETIVTVEVTDNTLGSLVCATPTYEGSMTFINTYTPDDITATLQGHKTISGREFNPDTDKFGFAIEVAENSPENTPISATTNVENSADGTITFAPITFTEAGTYIYKISETSDFVVAGVNNDSGYVLATVTVEYDSSKGVFKTPTISYSKVGGPNDTAAKFEFVNTYTTTPSDPIASITATKEVEVSEGNSYTITDGIFKFKLETGVNNPDSDPINANDGLTNIGNEVQIISNNVVYTEPGTYVYEVTEVNNGLGGMSYDDTKYVITVEVVDNEANAKLEATMKIEKFKAGSTKGSEVDSIVFNNSYNPTMTNASFTGTKKLTGTKPLEDKEFTFILSAVTENAPMPEVTEVKNTLAQENNINFGNITYTMPGEYEYVISERVDNEKGIIYSDEVFNVKVTVTDVDGELVAVTTYDKDVVFTNKYKPHPVTLTAETAIKANKHLEGRKLKDGEFEFELVDNNNKVVASGKNDENGKVVFSDLTFEETGEFYFTMVEKKNGISGIDYDTNTYIIKVEVTDPNYGGQLEADVVYLDQNNQNVENVTFENSYKAKSTEVQLGVTKVLEGRKLVDGEFTFVLKDAEGNVVDEANNDANGVVQFAVMTFENTGEYSYTISEVIGNENNMTYDETVYNVVINVEDDLKGQLKATVVYDGEGQLVFVNTYTPEEPEEETPPTPPAPTTPDTGDYVSVGLWLTTLFVSLFGFAALKKSKKEKLQ